MDRALIIVVFLVLFTPLLVFGNSGIVISGVPSYQVSIRGEYTTQSNILQYRELSISVSNQSVVVNVFGIDYVYSLSCPSNVQLLIDLTENNRVELVSAICEGSVVPLGFIICESTFCRLSINCNGCSYSGSLPLSEPVPQSSGGGESCAWWDLGCHLRNMFSMVIGWILGVLQAFWDWLVNTILGLLPQPVKDFFGFMGQLFGLLGELLSRLVMYFPYFAFVISLVLSFGLIYYVIEEGLVGVAKFFHMVYELFKKFIEVILQLIEIIYPF